MVDWIRTKQFGEKGDLVFLSLHDGDPETWLKKHPMPVNDLFLQYLNLERDSGASGLMYGVAECLGSGVECVEVLVPRGLLDLNRVDADLAHRKVWQLPAWLEEERQWVMNFLKEKVRGKVFIDFHTMWPFEPDLQCDESKLRAYVEAYLQAEILGEKRKINLLTQDKGGVFLADRALAAAFEQEFGAEMAFNTPYNFGSPDFRTTSRWLLDFAGSGIGIDVPKDQVDLNLVNRLASAIKW